MLRKICRSQDVMDGKIWNWRVCSRPPWGGDGGAHCLAYWLKANSQTAQRMRANRPHWAAVST